MRLLVDTQLLIWAGEDAGRLSHDARTLLTDPAHDLLFSSLAIAEIAIKHGLRRPDFAYDPRRVRAALLAADFAELPLTGEHAMELAQLPPIHSDPFDRLMVAQALVEGMAFVTADTVLVDYPGQVIVV